ncbi:MAG: hypothetical protein IPJ20_01175 [Flammeovirgaceae bacterium]|nr:hypothetical protein [Flammeovirgaceae bacterium]
MSTTVKISIGQTTLITSISIAPENDRIINDLKILCSNLSESSTYQNNKFSIPWYEFRRGLNGIALILRKESANVEFDSFATKLIQDVINDKRALRKRLAHLISLIATLTKS